MAVRLLLASASPRRRELLAQIGIAFDVKPSAFEERMDSALPPEQLVVQNALGKALDVQKRAPAELILGADTVVVFNRRIYGKPAGAADAGRMLGELQGQWHTVYTGIALVEGRRWRVAERATRVKLRAMAPEQIAAYVAGGEPSTRPAATPSRDWEQLWSSRSTAATAMSSVYRCRCWSTCSPNLTGG